MADNRPPVEESLQEGLAEAYIVGAYTVAAVDNTAAV